jgi:hypothetical protein
MITLYNELSPSELQGQIKNSVKEWEERIKQIRQQKGVSAFKNIAVADFQVGSDRDELIAVSGRKTRPGTVSLPQHPLFQTLEMPPGHSRSYDSEYKILEELASRYSETPEVEGTVNLLTERAPCPSCNYVIAQFRSRFPNISLTVNHTG